MIVARHCAALVSLWALLAFFSPLSGAAVAMTDVPAAAVERLRVGQPVDLILEYDAASVERDANALRRRLALSSDDARVLAFKAERFKILKRDVEQTTRHPDIESFLDYSHLPMAFKRFRSLAPLNAVLAHPSVKAVYENTQLHPVLMQSLPLINQPAVMSAGERGNSTTVAVIDNGVDYTRPEFGSCTAPGTPASCHIVVSLNFGSGTTENSHGTNVSAIVLGVAPDSHIAMLNAFSGTSASASDVISAINWSIANRSAYNIVAINMSLGDGVRHTGLCNAGNPYKTPIANARSAGMLVVAAAGNEAYTDGLSSPACTPGATSVGAVYDENLGGLTWGNNLCTDASTAADQVACFSDSASFLTMLAPGALIAAGGSTQGGTSQAAPHVAGAIATLRSTFPTETIDQIAARLTSSGVSVTDARNGIVKPRLNLLAAARPGNDSFATRFSLSGSSGTATGVSLLATKESGEPNHAGNSGGQSVWWKWTASATGQVSLDTHGSGFDTLLAVYTGTAVGALTSVSANDNDGSGSGASGLLFQAQSGTQYVFAIDGAGGAAGAVTLSWSLNTTARANLSIGSTGPTQVDSGATTAYSIGVSNTGPQTATNVRVTVTLPTGTTVASASSGCAVGAGVVICSVDSLANGASSELTLNLGWNTPSIVSVSATVTSDLPDPVTSNNSTVVQIAIVEASSDANVPLLPSWGLVLLAGLLMSMVYLPVRSR
jgi:uncharacterized repeat protein (TIGR01451 family)